MENTTTMREKNIKTNTWIAGTFPKYSEQSGPD